MDTEDGQLFIKNLAHFVRTHEKALANALQLQRQAPRNASSVPGASPPTSPGFSIPSSTSSILAAAMSLPYLNFASHHLKPAKLTLTPHHLFYLLSRFEELGIPVGAMNVRLENIHTDNAPGNYVSFLSSSERRKVRNSDRDSIRSMSSVRSLMSGMSALWSNLGLKPNSTKSEKQKAAIMEDLKYLYSAFTKIPCLRLAPDHKAHLIAGFEEFPFDTAVPLFAFKNLSALEISDIDFRQFFGWDRLAEQLRSLTVKRGGVDDPADLLINIVLDDVDKRRRRSSKHAGSPVLPLPTPSPGPKILDLARSHSTQGSLNSPIKLASAGSPPGASLIPPGSPTLKGPPRSRRRSLSPARPGSPRHGSSHGYGRTNPPRMRRSSGSSGSSVTSSTPRGSSSNLAAFGVMSASKWRFLRHLSLAENGLTIISACSLAPLANSLQSLDLSYNLFTEIPDSLATLTSLRALNLSNCMIESLHSLGKSPLPAITTLNLRANRLNSLAGIERLLSLERLDIRENNLTDPTEIARLTGIPYMREIYVNRNPFAKSHSNFRVIIFNLFRSSPGYAEDIIIDGTGPGYSERKQLVDRVPEPANVQVIQPTLDDETVPSPVTSQDTPSAPEPQKRHSEHIKESTSSHAETSDLGTQTYRRRKGPKRRIVELSQNEEPVTATLDTVLLSANYANGDVAKAASINPAETPELINGRSGDRSPSTTIPAQDWLNTPGLTEISVNGDLYKRRIEALKSDFGNSWLTALGDNTWEASDRRLAEQYSHGGGLDSSISTTRSNSHGIISSGRTFG